MMLLLGWSFGVAHVVDARDRILALYCKRPGLTPKGIAQQLGFTENFVLQCLGYPSTKRLDNGVFYAHPQVRSRNP